MVETWNAICKDCGVLFGYSNSTYERNNQKGFSRPERCSSCRSQHTKEISTFGMPYYEPSLYRQTDPNSELKSGFLGKLSHPGNDKINGSRIHKLNAHESKFDYSQFGISDDNITTLFKVMKKNQVTIVVGPTGSGKSTLLPYRMMVPPNESDEFSSDLWTRYGQVLITQPRIQATKNITEFVAGKLHGAESLKLNSKFFKDKSFRKYKDLRQLKEKIFPDEASLFEEIKKFTDGKLIHKEKIKQFIQSIAQVGAGHDIGYRYSNNPNADKNNKLVYVTDGTLINWIMSEQLGRFSVIMIDEAHERSVNIDLILGLLKQQLPRYPNLRLLIASATIAAENFVAYFADEEGGHKDAIIKNIQQSIEDRPLGLNEDDALTEVAEQYGIGYLKFSGKEPKWLTELKSTGQEIPLDPFGGQYYYTYFASEEDSISLENFSQKMPSLVARKAVEILNGIKDSNDPAGQFIKGDILAFLQGERPINEACSEIMRLIEESNNLCIDDYVICPLYTTLDQSVQNMALNTKKEQGIEHLTRIVVSTNVAETSLTVEGIVHIIETGLLNEARWEPEHRTKIISPIIHSQAGCKQRWGRSGRVSHGRVHCLYSEEQYTMEFPKYSEPEVKRIELEQLVLKTKLAGVDDVEQFDWIEPPPTVNLISAIETLNKYNALDSEGYVTDTGHELSAYIEPIDIAALMVASDKCACTLEMATLLSMIKVGGLSKLFTWSHHWSAQVKWYVYKIHKGLIEGCQDDLEIILKILHSIGTPDEENPQSDYNTWCDRYFVNVHFIEQLMSKRDALISSLSGHKKENETRLPNFSLINKVRKILIWKLRGDIYKTIDINQKHIKCVSVLDENESSGVIIGDDSIYFHKETRPHLFIGLKKKIQFHKSSVKGEYEKIVKLSLIIAIDEKWIDEILRPSPMNEITFLHYLSRNAERNTEEDVSKFISNVNHKRIFIDQVYPIGFRISLPKLTHESFVMPNTFISNDGLNQKDVLSNATEQNDTSEEDITIYQGDLVNNQMAEKLGPAFDLIQENEVHRQELSTDAEEKTSMVEQLDDEFTFDQSLIRTNQDPIVVEGKLSESTDIKKSDVTITGYDYSSVSNPTIHLGSGHQELFDAFVSNHNINTYCQLQVLNRVKFSTEPGEYLLLQDERTQFKALISPSDLIFKGRNFSLDKYQPGDILSVYIQGYDAISLSINFSGLFNEEDQYIALLTEIRKDSSHIYSATAYDINNNGVHLGLHLNEGTQIPLFCPLDKLDIACRGISVNSKLSIRVSCRYKQSKTPIWKFKDLDPTLIELLAHRPEVKLIEYKDNFVLKPSEILRFNGVQSLKSLSSDPHYQNQIERLYIRQFDINVMEVYDVTSMEHYASVILPEIMSFISDGEQQSKDREVGYLKGSINCILKEGKRTVGVDVQVEGTVIPVPIKEIWKSDISELKDNSKVNVFYINKGKNTNVFSLKDPKNNPILRMNEGQIIKGVVEVFNEENTERVGITLALSNGLKGDIPIEELSWTKINYLSQFISLGEELEAQVTHIDLQSNQVTLGRRNKDKRPEIIYEINDTYYQAAITYVNYENLFLIACVENDVLGMLSFADSHYSIAEFLKLSKGQPLTTKIKSINFADGQYEINLSSRDKTAHLYQKQQKLNCEILLIAKSGVHCQLERGAKCFIPHSILNRNNTQGDKPLKVDDRISVVVTAIDKEIDRILVKPISDNQQDLLDLEKDKIVSVRVVDIFDDKISVIYAEQVKGTIPIYLSGWTFSSDLKTLFTINQSYQVKVETLESNTDVVIFSAQIDENLPNLGGYHKARIIDVKDNCVVLGVDGLYEGVMYFNDLTYKYIVDPKSYLTDTKQPRIKQLRVLIKSAHKKGKYYKVAFTAKNSSQNPYYNYKKNEEVRCEVLDFKGNNIIVGLLDGGWSQIPRQFLHIEDDAEVTEVFSIGDIIDARVTHVSPKDERILLDHKVVNMPSVEHFHVDEEVSVEIIQIHPHILCKMDNGIQGLIPYSEVAWSYFEDITDLLSIGDTKNVVITKIDSVKNQFVGSVKRHPSNDWTALYNEGQNVRVIISAIEERYVIVEFKPQGRGMIHISEIADKYIKDISDHVEQGGEYIASFLNIDIDKRKCQLSLKK